jgi:hypothetical protein
MNQKIESISTPRRTRNGNFVFDVFMQNGDNAVWFNKLPFALFHAGQTISYKLMKNDKYFDPVIKLLNPKQTLNK